MGKYSVFVIAKWFLKHDSMTLKRLQKLCYYAQAWYYTLKGEVLIDTQFEAWKHGPVSRDLWNKFKFIYEQGMWMYDVKAEDLDANVEDITDVDDIELLEMVWDTYGEMTGNALEALTHNELPWKKARLGCAADQQCTEVISLEDMKDYYSQIYTGDYGEA